MTQEKYNRSEVMKKRWATGEMQKLFETEEYRQKKSRIAKERGYGKWSKGRKASEETRAEMRRNNAKYWLGKKNRAGAPASDY